MQLTDEQRQRLAVNYLKGFVERVRVNEKRQARLLKALPIYWRMKRGFKPDQTTP